MKSCCYLTVTKRGLVVESTYDAKFIDDLKALVPPRERSWDRDLKQWTVDMGYLDQIEDLACRCYEKAWLVEGGITTDLHTGETVNPLFELEG